MPVSRHILEQIKAIIPPLNGTLHKGQSGRVGVVGGALDYTGAPFFASISSMRFGADMSHVICSPTAGGAIKSYSPDLIVHPILREDSTQEQVKSQLDGLLSRLHVLVIGPGLGREDYMQKYARLALNIAKSQGMFIVLDADGLYMIGKDFSLIKGYRRVVLTPNVMEFKRLTEQIGIDPNTPKDKMAGLLSRALGGVTILQKGAKDIIAIDTTGEAADLKASKIEKSAGHAITEQIEVDVEGGMKRCGGQGDILSGSVAALLAWGKCYEDGAFGDGSIAASRMPILAAVGGSMVTREASRRAFFRSGRSLVTQDMLSEVGPAFARVFGDALEGQDFGKL